MASDIAQLANTLGGIIVLGVKEQTAAPMRLARCRSATTKNDASAKLSPSEFGPFAGRCTFRSIETSPGVGYFIIVVPQSVDAPHAVVQDKRLLAYPVRDGTKTRWLAEYEVAARYRDRYLGRAAGTTCSA